MDEKLVVEIVAEIGKLKTELDKAKKEIENFGNSGEKKLSDFNEAMAKVGNVANGALKVAAGALVGTATALVGVSAATAEYRQQQALLEAAFTTAGASADVAKETYNDLYRVLGDEGQAVEAANHLAKLTTNEQELAEWTTICQGVYATFGDSLPIEGLTEAANETAKVGSVTGSLADALNWAGISEDDFNEKLAACNSEAEREALIRKTLSGMYDEAARNYEDTAASTLAQNEAQAKLNENMAKLGEAVAPIVTALTELATTMLEQLAPAIQDFMNNQGSKLQELLTEIGEVLAVVIGFIIDNIEIISTVAAVVLAIAAAIAVYNGVMAIYNIVMAPVNLTILAIVAAIAALIAIVVVIITYWDELGAACSAAWEWIVNAVQSAIDWIVGLFNKIVSFVKDNWQALLLMLVNPFAGAFKLIYDNCEGFRQFIDNLVAKIKQFFVKLGSDIRNTFANIGSWFSEKFQAAANGVRNAFSSIGSFFSGIFNNIKSIFSKIGTAIGDGIKGAVSSAVNKVLSTACNIINGFISAINFAIDVLNAVPGVSISKLKKLSVPAMAEGGVVDSATLAVIGEQGKEMVMPLENNLEYLDKLAAMITERMGGGKQPIVLEVDGRVFGKIATDTINAQTKRTGKLALNLV